MSLTASDAHEIFADFQFNVEPFDTFDTIRRRDQSALNPLENCWA